MARNIQKQIDNAKRDAEVVRLRYLGHTFDAIAQIMGYSSRCAAYKAFQRGMEHIQVEVPQEARLIELRRLDKMTEKMMELLEAGDLSVIPELLKSMERRTKYLALDAPTKIQQEVITWEGGESIDRAVKELTALLSTNDSNSQSKSAMARDTGSA